MSKNLAVSVLRMDNGVTIRRNKDLYCEVFVGENEGPVCRLEWPDLERLKDFLIEILHPNALL